PEQRRGEREGAVRGAELPGDEVARAAADEAHALGQQRVEGALGGADRVEQDSELDHLEAAPGDREQGRADREDGDLGERLAEGRGGLLGLREAAAEEAEQLAA